MKDWSVRRGVKAAKRDNKPVGSLFYPCGKETYFINEAGEMCRRFERHPGIQAHRNCIWGWI